MVPTCFEFKAPSKLTSAKNFIYSAAKQTSEYLSPKKSLAIFHHSQDLIFSDSHPALSLEIATLR